MGNNHSRGHRCNILDLGSSAACALLVLGAAGAADAAENYAGWGRSGDLILDTSPAGADVQGTVANFPVLVRLNATNFSFAEARGQGQDVRFSNPDGSPLAYQIERWDSARALAEIWVRIGTVAGATAGQAYKMHWGNALAADSSNGPAVYAGHLAVWHLGGTGSQARPNAVAWNDKPAQPFNYNGDRNREGIIGMADELDGVDDYLDIGDGYRDPASGFSFSVWAYPKAAGNYARFFDLGNGPDLDNLAFMREGTGENLRLDNYNPGSTFSMVRGGPAISLNQWQHFAVNVSGTAVRIFRNGELVSQGALTNAIANVYRASNFLGRSNWARDAFFQGLLDEPSFSLASRSDDWYKLSYRNQKADQKLVALKSSHACVSRFQAPADTAIEEGGVAKLAGVADCAGGFSWAVLSGPAPRIIDPETRILPVNLPRVAGDTVIVYRFTAVYGDSTLSRDVRVRILEAIPEPIFTLPAGISWNGREAMSLKPAISNLAAIRASRDTAIHWSWTVSGVETDTAWLMDGLTLKSAAAEGNLEVGLCLDNSGPSVCRKAVIAVSRTAPTAVIPRPDGAKSQGLQDAGKTAANAAAKRGFRDAAGRLRSGTPSNLFGTPARPVR